MAHIFLLLSPIYLLPMIISKGHLCHLDGSDILIMNENDALKSWITIMMVAPADSAAFYKTITATNVSFIIIIIIILFSPQKSSKCYESWSKPLTGAFASLEPASRPPLPSPVTQYGGIGDRDVDDVMMTVMMLMMVVMIFPKVSLANNTWGCQCSLLHELQQVIAMSFKKYHHHCLHGDHWDP